MVNRRIATKSSDCNLVPHRRFIIAAMTLGIPLIFLGVGCMQSGIPDQSGYRPLAEMSASGQAVARLYAAPIPGLQGIATHSWFLIKPADGTEFERWEVWVTADGPYGYVRRNLFDVESDVGAGGVHILAEATGSAAEPIVAFIAGQSPTYSCRNEYVLLGVNSNTYIQWILNQTGWQVALPDTAIGKSVSVNCP